MGRTRRIVGAIGEWIPHSPVALLAFLIRHEVAHARGGEGYPPEFRHRDGRCKLSDMEDACNEAAGRWVRSLAEQWPEVLAEWRRMARAAKPKPVNRTAQTRERHAESLENWSRRLKLAQTKVRKYRTLLKATERRMAARSS
jgi:hypothetical protein